MKTVPLTAQQKEIWYAYKINPTNDTYNISIAYKINSDINLENIRKIYRATGNYFEAFKTKFIEHKGSVYQKIFGNFDGELQYQELFDSADNELYKCLEVFRSKPFNLEKDWLFKIKVTKVIKENTNKYYLHFVWHHIISDGITTYFFSKLFENLYNSCVDDIAQTPVYNIADYLSYEQKIVAIKKNEALQYWKDYLEDYVQNKLFKNTHNDNLIKRKRIPIHYEELSQFVKSHRITPFIFFVAVICAFVFRFFGTKDVLLFYPKNIRPKQFSKIIGYFISMFPLRVKVNSSWDFIALINYVKEQYKKDRKYQEVPFEVLKKSLKFNFSPNFSIVEACIISPNISLNGVDVRSLDTFYGRDFSKFLFAYETISKTYEITYNNEFIQDSFIDYFIQTITKLIKHPNQKLYCFQLISSGDKRKILYQWNSSDKPYPKDKTVYQLFEEQVAKIPDNIAVIFEHNKLTYAQLNARANQLGHYLRQQVEIKPDILIGLFLDKNLEMIIGILGILKAGGAYVPLDPSYPESRIRYILKDTQTPVILTQSHYIQRLSCLNTCLCIVMDSDCYLKERQDNLTPLSKPCDLAYVIYTSGTTGNPKGVMIEHQNIISLLFDINFVDLNSRRSLWTAYVFDVSVYEMFGSLLQNGVLFIFKDDLREDHHRYFDFLNKNKITIAYIPPFFIQYLRNYLQQGNKLYLKKILTGVDRVYSCDANCITSKGIKILNAYGPTETTICSSSFLLSKYYEQAVLPIGKPLQNEKCYVLDHHNQAVPTGVIGELHIAGAGLARGYLNQPELTATKFIPNPFATASDITNGYTRLYKTGDLVRWLPDGNLEYIGRNDFQVKIRGYRIELGEIETALLELQEIQQAIVIAHQRSKETPEDTYLVGYVTTDSNKPLNTETALHTLSQQLPEYMVPTALVQLETLPLTINGKVDRKALPMPQLTQKHYVAPSNAEETLICQAFAEILQIDKVSVTDDFFKLGGNSISAIRLSVILQQNFDIHLSEIFELRTPQNIAKDRTITPGALKRKLLNLKKQRQETLSLDPEAEAKIKQYQQSVKQLKPQKFTTKPINNVLLTGGAGFLGCNLLNQLLQLTHYTIYVFIRAEDEPAVIQRMEHKFQFYFEQSLQETYPSRVVFIPCDLEEPYLGLSSNQYELLASQIDTVIHAAALTKHYGDAETLRSANVDATINLLKFTQLTRLKDFHYISTHSVSEVMRQDVSKSYVFTEDDHPEPSATWATIYNQTKYLGEQHTRTYRCKGIQTNIYRIGNLAYMQNGKPQENYQDNAFITYLEFLKQLGCIPHGMDTAEISHADKTAEAIVRLFDKQELSNGTYHVFDPNPTDLYNLLTDTAKPLSRVTFNEFIDKVVDYIERCDARDLFGRFLISLGWEIENRYFNLRLQILQNRTEKLLKFCGFQWNIDEDG